MRHPTCVASVAACEGGRLQLVPRFRTDETLSSWLERFAGGYGMTVRDFTQWLGYRQSQPYEGLSRIDLDIDPPADLAPVLSRVSGLTAQVIEAQRMIPDSTLLPHLRRTYCAQCWAEEGPYRRREWASSWSLVCTHHGRLLAEKPPPRPPFEPDHEQSWLPFYRARQSWQDTGLAWQGERWRRICAALGVEPHTEFLRARLWFRGLQMLADRVIPQRRPSESSKIFPGGSTNLNSTLNTAPALIGASNAISCSTPRCGFVIARCFRLWTRRSPHHNFSRTESAATCAYSWPRRSVMTHDSLPPWLPCTCGSVWRASRGAAVTR